MKLPLPSELFGVETAFSVSATRYFWLVQFAPRSSVVILPPWWLKVPTTASTERPGPRTVIANEPPLTYVGCEPSRSCLTFAFQYAVPPASPAPVPANDPTVEVK